MAKGFKTGGRKKGTPNRMTADLKTAILTAFDQSGGSDYLIGIAKENPAVFCQLLGKVLPLQVASDPNNPMKLEITWQTAEHSK